MKFVIALIVLLVALVGGAYGLARAHMIPLAGIAKSSPTAKSILTQLALLPPPTKNAPNSKPLAPLQPAVDPLAAQKMQLAAAQQAVALEKIQLDKKLAAVGAMPIQGPLIPTAPHLIEIYEAMGSDDLAALFTKQPDSVVVSALIAMDTKKAAKALAAMPPDREVKLTAMMNQAMATAANSPQQPVP